MLLMDILEVGGTAIGVLKEGVFFNKTYKDLRKCLIENYNVREVISIPQDQFENTSTKTSIIIFDNTEEKTSEVIFRDLTVERYEEDRFLEVFGDIVVSENKGDIKGVSDSLVSQATRDEILENPICSLNGKDYNKKEIIVGEGYELVRLGDIAVLKNGKQLDKKNIIKGEYPVYGGGTSPVGFHNDYTSENCTIIAGTGSCGLVQFNNCKFWASQCFTIKSENDIINKYIYIICKSLEKKIKDGQMGSGQKGSAQKFIRAAQFEDVQIPIPKSQEKIQEWVDKISKPYNEKNEKQTQIKELEKYVQERIEYITKNEDCDEVELGNILLRSTNGKTNSNSVTNTGEYPFYSATASNPILTHSSYDFDSDKYYFLFAKSGGNAKTIYGEKLGIGKFWLVKGKVAANIAMIRFDINNNIVVSINYINTYLKYLLYDIQKSALYTTGNGNINVDDMLNKFKIKIPKNKKLIQDLDTSFQQIETLQNELNQLEIIYKQLIEELSNEAIPKQNNINNKTYEPVIIEEKIESKEEKEVIIPKKKIIKKRK